MRLVNDCISLMYPEQGRSGVPDTEPISLGVGGRERRERVGGREGGREGRRGREGGEREGGRQKERERSKEGAQTSSQLTSQSSPGACSQSSPPTFSEPHPQTVTPQNTSEPVWPGEREGGREGGKDTHIPTLTQHSRGRETAEVWNSKYGDTVSSTG